MKVLRRNQYPKGCAAPTGYVDWHEWAKAQHKHGLRQKRCKRCRLYFFPQEAASHIDCTPSPALLVKNSARMK